MIESFRNPKNQFQDWIENKKKLSLNWDERFLLKLKNWRTLVFINVSLKIFKKPVLVYIHGFQKWRKSQRTD
jgi:hypothetical protein